MTFFKKLFDKLGIKAEILQKGAYKGTGEMFTRSSMSPEFHEDIDSLVDDFYKQLIDTIAADRKLDPEKVKSLIDEGVFPAKDAKEAGLIDRVAYQDQLLDELKKSMKVDEIKLVEKYGKKKLDEDFSGFNGLMKLMQMLSGNEESASQRQESQDRGDLRRRRDRRWKKQSRNVRRRNGRRRHAHESLPRCRRKSQGGRDRAPHR